MTADSRRFCFEEVSAWFREFQVRCCTELGALDPETEFAQDEWQHGNGGGGITRVIENGTVFEKGGVNFSHVKGKDLPPSASAMRPHIAGMPFEAAGVSLVLHPSNPFVPTTHLNVRLFAANPDSDSPIWWFGGGFDLTPYYGFVEDCQHWHGMARDACQVLGEGFYQQFKQGCDEYFFLRHRNECRGIGGLFYDDLFDPDFKSTFSFTRSVGESFLKAYIPIVERRREHAYSQKQKDFQLYRRGRYVEFNLVYDRGTLFGLQSGGRTESILMSFPPHAQWKYNWHAEAGSEEERLTEYFLKPRDWLNDNAVSG